ncbi:MAG: hypothetical protein LUG17_02485, partial [Clostridiales bacterium]|nr:hypothetical protein [Clostridiales bacterium]
PTSITENYCTLLLQFEIFAFLLNSFRQICLKRRRNNRLFYVILNERKKYPANHLQIAVEWGIVSPVIQVHPKTTEQHEATRAALRRQWSPINETPSPFFRAV